MRIAEAEEVALRRRARRAQARGGGEGGEGGAAETETEVCRRGRAAQSTSRVFYKRRSCSLVV